MANEDGRMSSVECSSSPCMLHEVDAPTASHPAPNAKQEWAEVRLWRKAKRQVLIERRLAISVVDRAEHAAAVTALLTKILEPEKDRLIGFYWPFKGEYDPRPLVRSLHASGWRFALPVVIERAQPMVFREWWPGVRMSQGIWNIPVPAAGDPVFPEVLLVPLVGFDTQGYRLGYGGGYYDRTLAAPRITPRTIGIGYEASRVRTIHPQPHDIPMDTVVTEQEATSSQLTNAALHALRRVV